MTEIEPLGTDALCRKTDPATFRFKTTAELEAPDEWLGQSRAVEAVRFGIGMKRAGYNLFALGPTGAGKHTLVRKFIDEQAATEPFPDDWCYVQNFTEPHKPIALSLPPGRGLIFQKDMERLVEELKVSIPAAFESDDNRARIEAIEAEFNQRSEKAFGDLQKRAGEKSIALVRTPVGMTLAPVRNGEVLGPEAFQKLPEDEQKQVQADIETLQQELQEILREMPRWAQEHRERIRDLTHDITRFSVGHLIDEIQSKYQDIPALLAYLDAVEQDIVEHTNQLIAPKPAQPEALMQQEAGEGAMLRRYQVNLLRDHAGPAAGAPVVYENHPTHGNLIGRVEHISQFGALMTDFTLIKPGALHRANGGYLILEARKVLMQPLAWEELKRAIKAREIRIESIGQAMSLISTVSLEPEPIPLDVKVVLLGDRMLYYMLAAYDPEFQEIFKVAVDVEEDVERNAESTALFAQFVAQLAKRESLKPLDAHAVARVVDHAARLAGDSERLSCHAENISDILQESDYWAGQAGRETVLAEDVQRSIDAQIHRADRVRERSQDAIRRGTILIDTQGEAVGQVNGLAVLQLGGFAFGKPSRITASIQLGKGDVIDIERQVELGGPTHSKGVMILSGFLGARYAKDRPLALKASLAFEQSYGGVDGDSASSTELYALLSALADAPIKQSYAVTGSVNQHGQVQAIGGANEKIEGFFDICRQSGLTGDQGVLIPASNVKHLMLRDDVVEAAAAGKFRIYPVETIDQGIEILTGIPAGERDKSGKFPPDSINGRVEKRLEALSEIVRRFGHKDKSENSE
ncbi:MAG: AAA family ATPase [Alphaproteobacteria bacterium]|nr:AAA family ATPase [Alphaproteobacteria bacterium]